MAFLEEPRLRGVAVGSPLFFKLQRQIIHERPLVRGIYDSWYRRLLADERSASEGPKKSRVLELGSGGGYLKELCPWVITSDLVVGVADLVADGRELPFADGSVRAILLTHVFHHIANVRRFFEEAERVLIPGGVISMIEVSHTPFARLFFARLHPEPYDDGTVYWSFEQEDAMRESNQALSWIVFFRDRDEFNKLFPQLKVRQSSYLPWFSYILSGGVTRKSLVPGFLVPVVRSADRFLQPLDRLMALHWHITIVKEVAPTAVA
jgi:SAM-dependent methyltransferase